MNFSKNFNSAIFSFGGSSITKLAFIGLLTTLLMATGVSEQVDIDFSDSDISKDVSHPETGASIEAISINDDAERIALLFGSLNMKILDFNGDVKLVRDGIPSSNDIELDGDGNHYLATSNDDLKKYDSDGELLRSFDSDNTLYSVEYENDRIYAGGREDAMIVSPDGARDLSINTDEAPWIHSVSPAPDGGIFASGRDDKSVKYDSDGSEVCRFDDFDGNPQASIYLDDAGLLVAGGFGDTVRAIDMDCEEVWSDNVGDSIREIEKDSNENIYVSGDTESVHTYSSDGDLMGSNTYSDDTYVSLDVSGVVGYGDEFNFVSGFELPDSDEVPEDVDSLTGNFALSSTGTLLAGAKTTGAVGGILGLWEFGIRDFIFGTNEADSDLWISDIKSNAVTLEDNRENILQASDLSKDALFGDSMAEARAKGIQAFNNESSRQEAQDEISDTVEDYYSDVERVIINGYNNEVLNLQDDINNADESDADLSEPFESDFDSIAIVERDHTLGNGEDVITYEVVDDSGNIIGDIQNGEGQGLETTDGHEYISPTGHYDLIQDVRDARSDAITNVVEITDEIYDSDLEAGEIEVSEELSALELVSALSTDLSETGSFDFATTLLARSGIPTDLDQAFMIEYEDEELEGGLLADEEVTGENVEVGETYDGSDGNAVFVSQNENDAELVELESEFTVTEITSLDDGSELSNTSLQTSDVYSTDVNDLESEIDELNAQFEENTGFTGGFFGDGIGFTGILIVVILVLGLAIFLG